MLNQSFLFHLSIPIHSYSFFLTKFVTIIKNDINYLIDTFKTFRPRDLMK